LFCSGRACSAEGQDLVNEEEGLDGAADTASVDPQASQSWLRGRAQISPGDGKLLLATQPLVISA